jgi:hypothetical protein
MTWKNCSICDSRLEQNLLYRFSEQQDQRP